MAAEDRDIGCRGGCAGRRLRCRGREGGRTQPFGVRPVRDSDRGRLSVIDLVLVVTRVSLNPVGFAVHEW
ncbi:hypothetical protein [Streptomyces sp. SID12501]|uniref:Uncharacterized protein n=1 Tax=Streptomyces sp. SID12501 TaxID=2706042 RepID=A0A6B3BFH0_9ACTN|nr:hypothetical protein [Streptomyces sp. SID12501]NEC85207.1 hypothetical protein [Streptomyces sp. SID12501]